MATGREASSIRGATAAAADQPGTAPIRVTPDVVTWAFRLFLGREPKDSAELNTHLPHGSLDSLRTAFAELPEFQSFYDTVVKRRKPLFGVPPFLLRPPVAGVPWRFEPPSIESPVSQLCTAGQFEQPAFKEILQAMGMTSRPHRGVWQHVYVGARHAWLHRSGQERSRPRRAA